MKKNKVTNISNIKLSFFLKQDKEDVRIVLSPGETSWCDYETSTRSMALYERKKLINITEDILIDKKIEKSLTVALDIIPVKPMLEPDKDLFISIVSDITPLEKAQKETEEYKKESEKKYKGKKRGRKKKRGPKTGSKRKNKENTEIKS